MSRYDTYGYSQGRRGTAVFWIFFAILAFAAIYFPFFGGNLRYQVGNTVDGILTKIGNIIYVLGALLMVIGFLKLFLSRGGMGALRPMILGFLLLIIATWLVNPGDITTLSINQPAQKGYH